MIWFRIQTILLVLLSPCFTKTSESQKNEGFIETSPKVIVGGTEVTKGRYPYQVALMTGNSQYCGGTLIAPNYVLTAAHCAGYANVAAHIGRHKLSDTTETKEVISVQKEILHPNYDDSTDENDIMLVKLASSSTYSTVKLDNGSQTLTEGTDVTVMGWGNTEERGFDSDVLLEVEVDIVSNADCLESYTVDIFDSSLCAARLGKDSCQGDSGGPLIVKGSSAESDVQVGIVSWGIGCAREEFPGVYTRVSSYYDWITSHVEQDNTTLSPTISSTLPLSLPPTLSPTLPPTLSKSDVPSHHPTNISELSFMDSLKSLVALVLDKIMFCM